MNEDTSDYIIDPNLHDINLEKIPGHILDKLRPMKNFGLSNCNGSILPLTNLPISDYDDYNDHELLDFITILEDNQVTLHEYADFINSEYGVNEFCLDRGYAGVSVSSPIISIFVFIFFLLLSFSIEEPLLGFARYLMRYFASTIHVYIFVAQITCIIMQHKV